MKSACARPSRRHDLARPRAGDPTAWAEVDRYLERLFVRSDPALRGALRASRRAGLPPIELSPVQGKLLYLVARAVRARRILEIGTLGGYSTIWLARSLRPGGRLISLEIAPRHAAVARRNLARAGLSDRVEVRVGPARESLRGLDPARDGTFDVVFIDADKPSTAEYFLEALRLTRPGSLIVVDNVVRRGTVADATNPDPNVRGMRRFNRLLARTPRVEAVEIQTVGRKGHDGLALALVLGDRSVAPSPPGRGAGPPGDPAALRRRGP